MVTAIPRNEYEGDSWFRRLCIKGFNKSVELYAEFPLLLKCGAFWYQLGSQMQL